LHYNLLDLKRFSYRLFWKSIFIWWANYLFRL